MQFGSDDLAKYTFLPEAGNFIRDNGILISDLASKDYETVIRRAEERVLESIQKREVSYPIINENPRNEFEKLRMNNRPKLGGFEAEVLSFPIALALVKATKLEYLEKIYALGEAKRAVKLMQNAQASKYSSDREVQSLLAIFREKFRIPVEVRKEERKEDMYAIPISDYLKRASQFHKTEWKLVNKPVTKGKVILNRQDLVRLVGEEIQTMITDRLRDNPVGTRLPNNLNEIVKRIIAVAPPPPQSPYTIIRIAPENYPPCVRHSLDMLEKGENVPHYGRFLMATYLLSVGKSVDEIVAMFPKAPDFKHNVTRYQVEHLAGLKGGRTRYRVPSCKTLQTHQFCFKDPIRCYEISSPLQYPSRKGPQLERASERRRIAERGMPGTTKSAVSSSKERTKRDWMKTQRR